MNYNAVISAINLSAESGEIALLVPLTEMKDYLRLQGFVDSDSSPSTDLGDFDFDDNLITDMILGAAELIEEKAGISLTPRTMQAVITNLCGMIEIPYGPVTSITSLYDSSAAEILSTSYTTVGNHWKFLKSPLQKDMTITYEAGYTDLPRGIKIDIMDLVCAMYMNHETPGTIDIDDKCFKMVSKYSRRTAIL